MKVLKFGGSTLKNSKSLEKIKEVIFKEGPANSIIVVSAFNGTTDKLIQCAYDAEKNIDTFKEIVQMHKNILKEASISEDVLTNLIEEFVKAMESIKVYKEINPKILDYIMSFGERFCAVIVSEYLNKSGLKTKYLEGHQIGLITDSNFGCAKPLPSSYEAISKFLHNLDYTPVITGFIGKDAEGNYTTLGRNGSDYTAAIISYSCKAEYLKIYSDVDGILSGNPYFIRNTRPIEELSLYEYQELENWLKRIHPHMLSSVVEKNIPLVIFNINNPHFPGTKICYKSLSSTPKILIFRDDIFLNIAEVPKGKPHLLVARTLIDYFMNNNIKPLLFDIKNTQVSFILTSTDSIPALINNFQNEYIIYTYIDKVAIKIIGENINRNKNILKTIMDIAKKNKIDISIISYITAPHSCLIILDKQDKYLEFINELHDNIILK